jgi:hypothetical protein
MVAWKRIKLQQLGSFLFLNFLSLISTTLYSFTSWEIGCITFSHRHCICDCKLCLQFRTSLSTVFFRISSTTPRTIQTSITCYRAKYMQFIWNDTLHCGKRWRGGDPGIIYLLLVSVYCVTPKLRMQNDQSSKTHFPVQWKCLQSISEVAMRKHSLKSMLTNSSDPCTQTYPKSQ